LTSSRCHIVEFGGGKHSKEWVEAGTRKLKLGPVVLRSAEKNLIGLFYMSSYRKSNNHALLTEKGQHLLSSFLLPPQTKSGIEIGHKITHQSQWSQPGTSYYCG